ncbi:hypothetical protein HOO65_040403 [Ceratocystis lukuohia]|uniref:Midasin n=1 Tax=Ceratocystis lukuohia TaxID=2019550 RepID=A0ABR4MIH2_9PEZI
MASVDVSRCVSSLLEDAETLSILSLENSTIPNSQDALTDVQSTSILDAVCHTSLKNCRLTGRLFVHFENVFPDICARWLAVAVADPSPSALNAAVCAFGRILAFAPHISVLLERALESNRNRNDSLDSPACKQPRITQLALSASASADVLSAVLLAAWRLNNFSQQTYGGLFTPSFLQSLFKHDSRPVRYLAVRVFCQLLHAADKTTETLIREHVGGAEAEAVLGDFDGEEIDYIFLSIHERARVDRIFERQTQRATLLAALSESCIRTVPRQALTQHVVAYGSTMLPRPLGPPPTRSSTLIPTRTTLSNLESFAQLLQQPGAILLHGLPGTGKTALVREVAEELGMLDQMVTLHLNEQTDAKMLIGLYTTDSKPGSFTWRPGVLTTAVRQGRWVLIEDLDRAPAEVISTLLPLIERGELLIPSRGEKIRASNSFRLFATVRTTKGMNGRETLPHLLGLRFWQLLSVRSMSDEELRDVIEGLFPSLHKLIPIILAVYNNLSRMGSSAAVASSSRGLLRQMSLRDLLKWCRRLSQVLTHAGCVSGSEPISESTRNSMFQEAIDCFLGHLPDVAARDELILLIGREMHMSKETVEHYLVGYVPPLQDKLEDCLKVGRACLEKQRRPSSRLSTGPRRPFANTVHAKRLLEQISVSVRLREPVLLVGETGIGKTSVVQQLSDVLGHKLVAVNLSQQSEVGDLLGGFKPVNTRTLAVPLKEEFEDLFAATGISRSKNQVYLDKLGKCFVKGQWSRVSKLWREAPKMFIKILEEMRRRRQAEQQQQQQNAAVDEHQQRDEDGKPTKRRKVENSLGVLTELQPRWEAFSKSLDQFDMQISAGQGNFAFSFVEGNIIKAVRNGDWILLDEINLASPDTLESIADLLTDFTETPSILLSESGEIERITAHPNFRVFAAMNPATDVGKRDLPIGIRSRFTEIYVNSPDANHKDLLEIVKSYLRPGSVKDEQAADDITRLYLETKELANQKRLVDGANEVPHFSLRTLTRVLDYVVHVAPVYGLRRALFEGFSMGFLTLLNGESEQLLIPKMFQLLFGRANAKALLSQPPKQPNDGRAHIRFSNGAKDRHYWLVQGEQEPVERTDYIVTPSVERNLLNLVRATSTRRYPILIQGPTSAGKTSMIEYLAQFSGNRFVRINNHEHTDLQEYVGTYISGSDGKLRFQEGLLVQAMRKGYWIVLDELNLAPTDVLEALNRLLDDNRELLIPETQEVVRPHENFMLFATQNPPGLYGGRKVLSRAFRNRFLELHYDDIPESELEAILQRRSKNTSPSDCRRIVNVYRELSRLRQTSRLFEQKDSFATLRDLFRWALRSADIREQIANNGFMLLAERVRDASERDAVRGVIEKEFRVKISPELLYAPDSLESNGQNSQGVVWTHAMRRLYVLVAEALKNNEPVLLVGDTGCGKTTVCQVLAEAVGKQLHIVNAHQNTETGDLIGSQRPVRNRQAALDTLAADVRAALELLDVKLDDLATLEDQLSALAAVDDSVLAERVPSDLRERIISNQTRSKALFEWSDGSLVHAMKTGQFFLLDEISLADDSVLERLNSVLEPARTLLLAEKGVENSFVTGADGFQFFATMNPGGDFGKKELSPALRNRFTEIWVPPLADKEDILQIVQSKLRAELTNMASVVVDFSRWFAETFRATNAAGFSIREVLVWVQFMNRSFDLSLASPSSPSDSAFGLVHGAATVFIDSLGANPSAMVALNPATVGEQRVTCLAKLSELLGRDISSLYNLQPELSATSEALSISGFTVPRLPVACNDDAGFAFHAPTTRLNTMRVVRALSMQKPILLEGSPGVGKTTLVAALAKACGQPLTRINLSDQTDLMDLFGTDVPVEGEEAGNFAWRDAPFLQAMQKGEWVLLDEMNLASQSVLEGLNACLDHRGEVYISELDQVFKRHPDFRLFAAQNPHHQGGGRKGLPSSFVNRFIVVYADSFSAEDLLLIAQHSFPDVNIDIVQKVISFISLIEKRVVQDRAFGALGGPWEFNLRDTLRWLHLLSSKDPLLGTASVGDFFDMLIGGRFRSKNDRAAARSLFAEIFGALPATRSLFHDLSPSFSQVGMGLLPRDPTHQPEPLRNIDVTPQLAELEAMMVAVKQGQPVIISGPSGSGKSALIGHLAGMAGKELVTFALNADVDTMDLVGGFEQHDPLREVNAALKQLHTTLRASVLSVAPSAAPQDALELLTLLETFRDSRDIPPLSACAEALAMQISPSSAVGVQLTRVSELLSQPLEVSNPRFEWLDGVIIRALEAGSWLVLDNANLCAASVLDRLNSLLEPGGFVSINEHCGVDGEPRIVRPQPGFHIFMTMDPRYGELSRAMRNRAVEIHLLEPLASLMPRHLSRVSSVEASLQRLQRAVALTNVEVEANTEAQAYMQQSLTQLAAQGLSMADVALLQRFISSVGHCILSTPQLRALETLTATIHSDGAQDLWTEVEAMYGLVGTAISPKIVSAQPILPVRNSPLIPLLSSLSPSSGLPYWLAVWFEYHQELLVFNEAIAAQAASASPARLSSLNRFQRSFLVLKGGTKIKDTTAGVAKFLQETFQVIQEYLRKPAGDEADLSSKKHVLRLVMHHLHRTFVFTTASTFEDAAFQSHMALGASLATAFSSSDVAAVRDFAVAFHACMVANFSSGFNLTTGLWMEQLWRVFRPMPLANDTVLSQTSALAKLAVRFDALRWKAKAPVKDLSKAAATLCTAYGLVRCSIVDGNQDMTSLVDALAAEVATLDTSIGGVHAGNAADLPPFFAQEFEALRQLLLLDTASMHPYDRPAFVTAIADISTLASAPTFHAMLLHDSPPKEGVSAMQLLDFVVCQGAQAKTIHGAFLPGLIGRLSSMSSANLDALSLLETELPIMGRYLAAKTDIVVQDSVDTLDNLRREITDSLLSTVVSEGSFDGSITVAIPDDSIPVTPIVPIESWTSSASALFGGPAFASAPDHVIAILKDHLAISLTAGQAVLSTKAESSLYKTLFAGISWVQLALAALKLYVPDKAFDPQLRSALEIDAYSQLQAQLQARLDRIVEFELLFTSQPTSAQVAGLQSEIACMGPSPSADVVVFRPQRSELAQVQTEFGNIVKSILRSETMVSFMATVTSATTTKENIETPFGLISGNINHVIDRLAYRFDAYQDMIRPAINMLRCLQVGLSLCSSYFAETALATEAELTGNLALMKSTPFLGASHDAALPSYKGAAFEFLHRVTLNAAIQGIDSFDAGSREAVFQCFHTLYDDWKKKLEADQKEEAANQSVFHFKGSYEDEVERDEEEFNELFPTFDEEEDEFGNIIAAAETKKPESATANKLKVRDMSIRVAEAHSRLLLDNPEPASALRELVKTVGRKAAPELSKSATWEKALSLPESASTSTPSVAPTRSLVSSRLLPAAMVDLHDSLDSIMASSTPADYNFYTSPHLHEARAVVALADRVKTFFLQLQQIDEIGHMQPLKDVILRCNKLLELGHTEPLAKLLPKVEQLHGTVYEWQFGGWASRTYQSPALYDNLTKTITRWRGLELTTWAKLLDMEAHKCVLDARSWWFVAYQATIAVPGALLNGPAEHLEAYTAQLVADLQMYFSTAPIGQFEARLDLLRAMQKHLQLMCAQYPALKAVCTALANFIAMTGRFSAAIAEHISRGRAPIEKQMKMDVKLASWKDVNISALRESARKSHQKLFKHVRKFRGVLAQPMAPVIERGIPEEKAAVPVFVAPETVGLAQVSPSSATDDQAIVEFLASHRRLANAPKTVSLMAKAATLPSSALPAAASLNSFVDGLLESIAELRKETPEFLTDENKDMVKHLKARKRKLFSDTLKDLKTMGLRYHLGTDTLAAQSSSALVLASAKSLAEPAEGADFYWHKLVDLLPKARRTPNDHHAELTGGEVSRCVGYLEGILVLANSQRALLSSAGTKLLALEARIEAAKNLASVLTDEPVSAVPADVAQSCNLAWLVEILRFSVQLTKMHAKLGGCDNSAAIESLDSWLNTFENLRTREKALCTLPDGLSSSRALELSSLVAAKSREFTSDIHILLKSRSDLAFVLSQLLNWSGLERSVLQSHLQSEAFKPNQTSILDFAADLSLLCDKALVAVEAYKKNSVSLPPSTDTPGWFSVANKAASLMFSALRPEELDANLSKLTGRLASVNEISSPASHAALSCLMSLAVPILTQYALIVRAAYERHLEMHSATVYLGWMLGRAYTQIAAQGFCTPQEKSDEKADAGEEGKLESGTGLGDGEGAEDISKDVEPDEDLTELAQEPNEKKDGEMEDNKDAIDMAGEELEGEDGSAAGDDEDDQKGDDGDEEDDGIDDEIGDVDDLDPTAVDEKMWDGDDEDEAEKDQQGDEAKGQQKNEEQAAEGQQNEDKPKKDDQMESADADEAPEDEDEDVQQAPDEAIRQDQNVEESEILGAPEDMDLDLQDMAEEEEEEQDDAELGDLDMEAGEEDEVQGEEEKVDERDGKAKDEEKPEDDEEVGEAEAAVDEADDSDGKEDPEDEGDIDMAADEPVDLDDEAKEEGKDEDEEQREDAQDKQPDDSTAADNVAPSEIQSGGQDQNADSMDSEDAMQGSKDMQEDGGQGSGADEKEADAGTQGASTRPDDSAAAPDSDSKENEGDDEAEKIEPFRKLGEALEQWHRQKREIKEPGRADDTPKEQAPQDKKDADAQEMQQQEFQHLQDDAAVPDAQAIGAATEDEVQPIDDAMAIDEETEDPTNKVQPVDDAAVPDESDDVAAENADNDAEMDDVEAPDALDIGTDDVDDARTGVKTRTGAYNEDPKLELEDLQESSVDNVEAEEPEIEETSTQLSATHLDADLLDFSACLARWDAFTTSTFALSQSLTAQLRLILTPSQSTKLSGAFRTGKRLAIKRIIPYIASSYKRDKIWLRRAVPTKRSYQILIAVDDSKSMGESGSGVLALQSLVMVSRALSALEVGQVGVLSFGADVVAAHDLAEPFSSADAGARALQRFRFAQDRTDVRLLIRRTIDTFKAARLANPAAGSEDLWQLALILSDGITPSSEHDAIRRLLREAVEERIMVVFIIMDDAKAKGGPSSSTGGISSSVLDLKFSTFVKDAEGNAQVVMGRYLDTFPFQYYLIVHHLDDLPGALAGLLRTWFAEVAA